MTSLAQTVVQQAKISVVYAALTGIQPRHGRAPATWRKGTGNNVALNDNKGSWYDHAANEGGGMLDLVVRVRGGSRRDALQWIADLVGVQLDDKPQSREERNQWIEEQRRTQRELRSARQWRAAAVVLMEDVLECVKIRLFYADADFAEGEFITETDPDEVRRLTTRLAYLRRIDGVELVNEYLWWRANYPSLTAAVRKAAQNRETAAWRKFMDIARSSEVAA